MSETATTTTDLPALAAARAKLREEYLAPRETRPSSSARGLHHTALISTDVEKTIKK